MSPFFLFDVPCASFGAPGRADYLNAATNFMDTKCAAEICDMLEALLRQVRARFPQEEEILFVGMECAGGVRSLSSPPFSLPSSLILCSLSLSLSPLFLMPVPPSLVSSCCHNPRPAPSHCAPRSW